MFVFLNCFLVTLRAFSIFLENLGEERKTSERASVTVSVTLNVTCERRGTRQPRIARAWEDERKERGLFSKFSMSTPVLFIRGPLPNLLYGYVEPCAEVTMIAGLITITTCLAIYSNWEDEIKLVRRFSFIFEVANLEHGLTVVHTSVVVCA